MFLNRYYPNHPRKEKCEKIWAKTVGIEEHSYYVGCARSIMDDTMEFDKIIIYPKGSHKAWVRDIWLTQSEWAPRDFMLHDLEEYKITNDPIQLNVSPYNYSNPFLSDAVFHSAFCTFPDGLNCWKYNTTFIKSDKIVDEKIKRKTKELRLRYLKYIDTL
uniref:Uncharacterized protein n=1 Tax=Panagrolaimus sp. PS1159 TaxID=55785 RepID=A0AC35FG48_9BILA